jgi:hypothetical protein
MPVAAGETFATTTAEIAVVQGLREALATLLRARVVVEAEGGLRPMAALIAGGDANLHLDITLLDRNRRF